MRHRWGVADERGAITAEQVAVLVLLAALIATIWAVGLPDRVDEASQTAADCLFSTGGGDCEVAAQGPGGSSGDGPGTGDEGARPTGPPPDREVIDGAGGDGREEGDDEVGDAEVDGLYEHFGEYYGYLWDRFGRVSYDDDGAPMVGTVRSPTATGNAYWDPVAEEMHYGEGYAVLDVTAHELTHALISSTADLVYQDESGALNEAIADMFASNVDGNWTIGEDLPIGAIRDMSDPEAHGDPAHVDDFVDTDLDHGGVHTNSGIPNHAYYLMVEGIGREDAEQILYLAVTEHLTSTSGFEDFRTACLEAAEELFGADSVQHDGVDEAFAGVGLDGTWEAPS